MTTANPPISRNRGLPVAVIALLFLGTGVSGLVYQVVWQRFLLNVFGATVYSVSTVLAAFMGGLALGSWLFGKRAARMKRHLVWYGALEILIGVSALLVPFLLKLLDPVFVWAYREFGSQFLAYSAIRFAFVGLVLLIPTSMMGATLPILSQYLAPWGNRDTGRRVGLLYTVNTAGAVAGAFLSGFYLIRWWGVSGTVLLAAGINIIAGLAAIALGFATQSPASEEAEADAQATPMHGAETANPDARFVYLAYAISGFAALGLEVVWSRALVFTFDSLKNTTYAFTAMLATFLIGIAAGSACATAMISKFRQPYRTFSVLQVFIGLLSVLSFFTLYRYAPEVGGEWIREFDDSPGRIRWTAAVVVVFLRTASVLILPTFLMGFAFPFAVRAVTDGTSTTGPQVGRLYALNTIGAIAGSASVGFVLLPALGIANTIMILGVAQIAAGVALIARDPGIDQTRKLTWGVLSTIAALGAWAIIPSPALFQLIERAEHFVFYKEGPLATVSVVENSLKYRTIYVDNVGVAGTDPILLTDQKSLAHVPVLFLREPKSALTVGFGSGGASYSYTLYPEMERVDCVEITRTVPEAADSLSDSNRGIVHRSQNSDLAADEKLLFRSSNGNHVTTDTRYSIIFDDARSYLRFTDRQYSVIATDCTDLRYKSNANLYDLEYFRLTRERITDDGMVVVWMPLAGLSDAAMKAALRTFYVVFPEMEVFFMNNQPTHYVLLIGTKSPLTVDVDLIRKRLENPAVARDLGEIHLASAEKLLSCLVTGRDQMKAYLGKTDDGILNTEDFPYLEFESPRYGYNDQPLLDNLDELFRYRDNPSRLVADAPGHAAFMESLKRYDSATSHIIDGHRNYRNLRVLDAVKDYMKANSIAPDDASVRDLLNLEELRRKIQGQPNNWWAKWTYGEAMALQKRDAEAVTALDEFLAMRIAAGETNEAFRNAVTSALNTLVSIYDRLNRPEKSAEYKAILSRVNSSR